MLLNADDVALLSHPVKGFALFRNHGRDALYRLVLGRPEFEWAVDGDALLRQRKPEWSATADLPDLVVLLQVVVDAMADASGSSH